jgi:F0F1-type ATP synthase membrane subunit b/b'
MSNGTVQNRSILPVMSVIVGIIALAAVGWGAALQMHSKVVDERVKKLERRLDEMDKAAKDAEAAAARARRKARQAEANEHGPDKTPEKSPEKSK